MMESINIPKKLFFRIGEVCELLHLEPYVLRFWESEFPMLSPTKGANGRRMYRQKDVEMVITIKRLLYDQGFTIAGAKRVLTARRGSDTLVTRTLLEPNKPASSEVSPSPKLPAKLDQLRAELRNILTILNRRC